MQTMQNGRTSSVVSPLRASPSLFTSKRVEGILWELKHLVAGGHLTKTLCILNPRTSLATIQGAIEEARRSDNTALCDMLERVRATISSVGTSKVVVGFRCTDGVVAPIIAEDASDYTHWCMVNLMLLALT